MLGRLVGENGDGDKRIHGTDGQMYIPSSQRPDGTWRKPIKVKAGYVPQDEVPKYESKGKQWSKDTSDYPVGLSPEFVNAAKAEKSKKGASSSDKTKTLPNPANKKTPGIIELPTKRLAKLNLDSEPVSSPDNTQLMDGDTKEKMKKLKTLKKKLKDIDDLQAKIDKGELKTPEKNQLEKISKRSQYELEMFQIETELDLV